MRFFENLKSSSVLPAVFFFFFFLGSLLQGCASSRFSPADIGVEPRLTQFGDCSPTPCLKTSVSPLPPLPQSVPLTARDAVYRELSKIAYAPLDDDEPGDHSSYASLIRSVEEVFTEGVDEQERSAPIDWSLERTISTVYWDSEIVTLDVRSRGYLGGAHGFDERQLLTFRAKDGKRLTLHELVEPKSLSLLSTVAEAEVRRTRGVPAGQSLQDAGFTTSTTEPFLVPENFGVVEAGLLVRYNPYEIAPYALGPTEVTLPREAIGALLVSPPAKSSVPSWIEDTATPAQAAPSDPEGKRDVS